MGQRSDLEIAVRSGRISDRRWGLLGRGPGRQSEGLSVVRPYFGSVQTSRVLPGPLHTSRSHKPRKRSGRGSVQTFSWASGFSQRRPGKGQEKVRRDSFLTSSRPCGLFGPTRSGRGQEEGPSTPFLGLPGPLNQRSGKGREKVCKECFLAFRGLQSGRAQEKPRKSPGRGQEGSPS